jgi:hypothetical protein
MACALSILAENKHLIYNIF